MPIFKNGNPEAGYYAVGPGGRIVVQPKLQPLKGGWREATQEDIDAQAKAERERSAKESAQAQADHENERAVSHEVGLEQKQRDAENAEAMKAAAAEKPQRVIAGPEPESNTPATK